MPKKLQIAGVMVAGVVGLATLAASAQQDGARPQPVLNFVGVTGLTWGTWVAPGVSVEEWVAGARQLCGGEEYCRVHVFEGPELATHEDPVPEANLPGLKWVLEYRHGETPRIVVEEAQAPVGRDKRKWTFDE